MGAIMSLPNPDGARPALWAGAVWREELLDLIRRGFEKRWRLKGAQKGENNLGGWRGIGGGGLPKEGST